MSAYIPSVGDRVQFKTGRHYHVGEGTVIATPDGRNGFTPEYAVYVQFDQPVLHYTRPTAWMSDALEQIDSSSDFEFDV